MTHHDDVRLSLGERLALFQIESDAEARTVMCNPDLESRVKMMPMPGNWTVVVSPVCPEDSIFIIDSGLIEAAQREFMQHWKPEFRLPDPDPEPPEEVLERIKKALREQIQEDIAKAKPFKITGLDVS